MTNTIARIKAKGKHFEILVDVDSALNLKKGLDVNMQNVLALNQVFTDHKKGLKASEKDLTECFGTSDVNTIADKIIKSGEILLPLEYKKSEREDRIKQVIEFLSKNALDPGSGRPHTADRIKNALEQTGVNIENKPVEAQINKIISELRKILPIKLESKRLKILIPAIHTGRVYGLVNQYKEKESWLGNGDLEVIINLPSGLQMEFYDKLNDVTHGSSIVEELKT
jgi:ribosome maturation protein SDO1